MLNDKHSRLGAFPWAVVVSFLFPTSYTARERDNWKFSPSDSDLFTRERNQLWVRFSTLYWHEKKKRCFVCLCSCFIFPGVRLFSLSLSLSLSRALNSSEGSNNRCMLLLRSEQRKRIVDGEGKCSSTRCNRNRLTRVEKSSRMGTTWISPVTSLLFVVLALELLPALLLIKIEANWMMWWCARGVDCNVLLPISLLSVSVSLSLSISFSLAPSPLVDRRSVLFPRYKNR